MKTKCFQSSLLAIAAVAALVFTTASVTAQDSTIAAAQPAVASQPAPQLSYGVPQVLQLVQAKVSDGIIVNYIQNSGTIYSLTAGEIVYLKQQGVSDSVLNAMLNQRSRLTGSTEPATTTASSPDCQLPDLRARRARGDLRSNRAALHRLCHTRHANLQVLRRPVLQLSLLWRVLRLACGFALIWLGRRLSRWLAWGRLASSLIITSAAAHRLSPNCNLPSSVRNLTSAA